MAGCERQRIPSENEFSILFKDSAFVDYFNVFLNQPIFGQRVIYRVSTESFVLDPPVHKRRYKVYEAEVRDWLRTQRFPAFVQSDLFVEYNLCCRLRDTRDGFLNELNGDLQSNTDFWEQATDFLVGQVLGMQHFRYSLKGTPGEAAITCWLDLERFRRLPLGDPRRPEVYQYIKETYLVNGATRELTKIAKHQALKGTVDFNLLYDDISVDGSDFFKHLFTAHTLGTEGITAFSEETFSRLQSVMLAVLKSYWLPRYILRVQRTMPKTAIKKYFTTSRQDYAEGFFSDVTKQRVQAMFSGSINESESLNPSATDVITDVREDTSDDDSDLIDPSELFLLWGGQRFHEAKLFPTYEDLTSGQLSDVSSKSRGGSLWTPPVTDSTALSPHIQSSCKPGTRYSSDDSLSESNKPSDKGKACRNLQPRHSRRLDKINVSLHNLCELSTAMRHYIRGTQFVTTTTYERDNTRLIAAIASDSLAGKPFEDHLRKFCAFGSQMYLMLWSDLHEYIQTDVNATDSVGRSCKQLLGVKILRRYFLNKSSADNRVGLFLGDLQDELYTSLLHGTSSEALIRTQEICCKALKPVWQEFIIADRHVFVHKVVRHGLRQLSANRKHTNSANKEVLPNSRLDAKNIWRALELALASKFPLGLKPEFGVLEMANMNNEGYGSLSRPLFKPVYNRRLRELAVPPKLDINKLKVTPDSLYQRPEIPADRTTDAKGFQLRRNGVVIDRPPKPRSFPEVLTSSVHFEFFKRFLVTKRAAAPLFFWKQVQDLKETKSPRQRVSKVTQIFRRYFSKNAHYGAQLDCPDEIIKQITMMERVTASMIVCAQGAVMRSLERKWLRPYLETYPADDVRSPLSSPAPDQSKLYDFEMEWTVKRPPTKLQTYSLWVKFLRIVTYFIRSLKNHQLIMLFWVYLRLQVKKAVEKKPGSPNTSEIKILLHNRLVVVNKLPQDLLFWVEVSKYTELIDDACKPGLLFNVSKVDEENLRLKASAIVSCFLFSDIQPKLQINVTPEAAANVISLLGAKGPTRSMFHDCLMTMFPVLFHYYKCCCEEWGLMRRRANLGDMYMEKLRELKGNVLTDSPHGSQVFPTYGNLKLNKLKKVMGPRGDDCVRINFTIANGIRIIIPTDGGGNRNRTVQDGRRQGSLLSTGSGSKHSGKLRERSSKSAMRAHSKLASLPRIASVETNRQNLMSATRVHTLREAEVESSSSLAPTLMAI